MRALAVVALLGCRGGHTLDAKSANDLVPDRYKYKLEFAEREVVAGFPRRETYTALIPKGWRVDNVGVATAVDTTANGDSSIWLGASCDQALCLPEDWNATIDRKLRHLDAAEYHWCEARMTSGLDEAAAAFEKACESAIVNS